MRQLIIDPLRLVESMHLAGVFDVMTEAIPKWTGNGVGDEIVDLAFDTCWVALLAVVEGLCLVAASAAEKLIYEIPVSAYDPGMRSLLEAALGVH